VRTLVQSDNCFYVLTQCGIFLLYGYKSDTLALAVAGVVDSLICSLASHITTASATTTSTTSCWLVVTLLGNHAGDHVGESRANDLVGQKVHGYQTDRIPAKLYPAPSPRWGCSCSNGYRGLVVSGKEVLASGWSNRTSSFVLPLRMLVLTLSKSQSGSLDNLRHVFIANSDG
jgi:hypothetical protein